MKLEAICEGGSKQGGALLKELVSDREERSTPTNILKKDSWSEADCLGKGPEFAGASSPLQKVQAYQIPLVDRSLNQSLSYPPPPPPSPGFALKVTPSGSPASGQVEDCFVFPSPNSCPLAVPPAAENTPGPDGTKEIVSSENPLDTPTNGPKLLPTKSASTDPPAKSEPDQPTETTTSVPATEDAPPPPAAAVPEVASQTLPQYPQLQQPVAAAASAQPIIVTQQVRKKNIQFHLIRLS